MSYHMWKSVHETVSWAKRVKLKLVKDNQLTGQSKIEFKLKPFFVADNTGIDVSC